MYVARPPSTERKGSSCPWSTWWWRRSPYSRQFSALWGSTKDINTFTSSIEQDEEDVQGLNINSRTVFCFWQRSFLFSKTMVAASRLETMSIYRLQLDKSKGLHRGRPSVFDDYEGTEAREKQNGMVPIFTWHDQTRANRDTFCKPKYRHASVDTLGHYRWLRAAIFCPRSRVSCRKTVHFKSINNRSDCHLHLSQPRKPTNRDK